MFGESLFSKNSQDTKRANHEMRKISWYNIPISTFYWFSRVGGHPDFSIRFVYNIFKNIVNNICLQKITIWSILNSSSEIRMYFCKYVKE